MTIASEISRLQGAKADICTAIENKGVTVGNITLDNYASCIDAIQQGGGEGELIISGNICFVDGTSPLPTIKYIAVGGGGGGAGGGGGGGEVCYGYRMNLSSICVSVGSGGGRGWHKDFYSNCPGCSGCPTTIVGGATITALGGCPGTTDGVGGSSGSGYSGGNASGSCWKCGRGGGGGAGGAGCNATGAGGGNGGAGICGFGGGGGGVGCNGSSGNRGTGPDGGGNGENNNCNATNYGGGGGSAYTWDGSGNGCQGVVDICYLANGDWGIESASGGDCCFTCDGYCVHRFTSNGTFTVN